MRTCQGLTAHMHVISNYYIATTDNTGASSLFKWNATSAQFALYELLPLANPQELVFFAIGATSYLAVRACIITHRL